MTDLTAAITCAYVAGAATALALAALAVYLRACLRAGPTFALRRAREVSLEGLCRHGHPREWGCPKCSREENHR
jgi:hypothetical protein